MLKGIVRKTFGLFHWRVIFSPWRKIRPLIDWWLAGSKSLVYRTLAFFPWVLGAILTLAIGGPLVTGYPAIWVGTYAHNYYSVIYPEEIYATTSENGGSAILDTLIKLGEEKLVNWQPNDLLISSSRTPWIGVDNPRSFQLGGLFIYRRVLEELREDLTRATSNDYLNPLAVNAFSKWSYDADSWWLPRTEDVYKDGLDSLKQLREDVKRGKATIFITSLKMTRLLEKMSSGLAGIARRLDDVEGVRSIVQKDATGKTIQTTVIAARTVPFNEWDDAYYEAQGALRETLQILRAVQKDAKVVFDIKGAEQMFQKAMRNIEEDKSYLYDPFMVIKGGFLGIPSNCSPLTAAIQRTIGDMKQLIPQLNN